MEPTEYTCKLLEYYDRGEWRKILKKLYYRPNNQIRKLEEREEVMMRAGVNTVRKFIEARMRAEEEEPYNEYRDLKERLEGLVEFLHYHLDEPLNWIAQNFSRGLLQASKKESAVFFNPGNHDGPEECAAEIAWFLSEPEVKMHLPHYNWMCTPCNDEAEQELVSKEDER